MKGMEKAIFEADTGVTNDHGGPFGACIVYKNEIIASAHNTVIVDNDPTKHAEINAISQASKKLKTHILKDCEMYTTAEPCPMCYSAAYWARIKKIYFGVDKIYAAEYGFDDSNIYKDLLLPESDRSIILQKGIFADKCKDIFEKWKALNRTLY